MTEFIPKPPSMDSTAIQVKTRPRSSGRKPSLRVVDVQAAAHNISVVNKRGKFSEEELVDLLQMLAEGATERKIINTFRKRHKRAISSHTITQYRKDYAGRILEIARGLETLAIEAGLTKRNMRLIRLQELAEALEGVIFNDRGEIAEFTSAKLIDEYRAVLAQIGQETGDLQMAAIGDVNFIGMSNDELKTLAANKLAAHKDLAVTLAEKAGVRPTIPETGGEDNERRPQSTVFGPLDPDPREGTASDRGGD